MTTPAEEKAPKASYIVRPVTGSDWQASAQFSFGDHTRRHNQVQERAHLNTKTGRLFGIFNETQKILIAKLTVGDKEEGKRQIDRGSWNFETPQRMDENDYFHHQNFTSAPFRDALGQLFMLARGIDPHRRINADINYTMRDKYSIKLSSSALTELIRHYRFEYKGYEVPGQHQLYQK